MGQSPEEPLRQRAPSSCAYGIKSLHRSGGLGAAAAPTPLSRVPIFGNLEVSSLRVMAEASQTFLQGKGWMSVKHCEWLSSRHGQAQNKVWAEEEDS